MRLSDLFLSLLTCTVVIAGGSQAQNLRVTGVVRDAATMAPLPYATVTVRRSSSGTTADRAGRFTLSLPQGRHILSAGHIGYTADTKEIPETGGAAEINFFLQRGQIELPEVIVTPGDNPALEIIRNAIEAKNRRRERLDSYKLTSHSKAVVSIDALSGADISFRTPGGRGRIGATSDSLTGDSAASVIILETLTDAVWAKPDRYKEVIRARKQTAQIPAQANLLISSFFIMDFSADLLRVADKNIVGPISAAGLRNYDYTLVGAVTYAGERVNKIEIRPLSEFDPLLIGAIYITEGSYALAMADLRLSKAALPAFTDSIRFRQHFRPFEQELWMPTDVIVEGGISVSAIISLRMRIEAFSVLQDYRINEPIDESFFDRTRIKVLKEADGRDSLFWIDNRRLLNSEEEFEAYRIADSLQSVYEANRNSWTIAAALSGHTITHGKTQLIFPGLPELYRFNRVDGHSIEAPLTVREAVPMVETAGAALGYAFGAERWNTSANITFRPVSELRMAFSFADRTSALEGVRERLGAFSTTLSNILLKYDDKDYHRERGFRASVTYDLLRLFPTTFSAGSISYTSLAVTSDWSIFRRSRPAPDNPPINDGHIFHAGMRFSFDNRDFIDNAGEIRRFGRRNHMPRVSMTWHRADIANETWDFGIAEFTLNGSFNLGRVGNTFYRLEASGAFGKLPRQSLLFAPGSIPYTAARWQFRTAKPREFGGDRIAALFIEHDFNDQLFRWMHLPLLEGSGFGLRLFASASWIDMTESTRRLQPAQVSTARRPLVEAGFGIDRILLLFRVDFTWRIVNRSAGADFFIGLSSPIIF